MIVACLKSDQGFAPFGSTSMPSSPARSRCGQCLTSPAHMFHPLSALNQCSTTLWTVVQSEVTDLSRFPRASNLVADMVLLMNPS